MRSALLLLIIVLAFPLFSEESVPFIINAEPQLFSEGNVVWSQVSVLPTEENDPLNLQFNGNNFKMMIRITWIIIDEITVFMTIQSETLLQTPDNELNFHSNMKSMRVILGDRLIYYPLGGEDDEQSAESLLRIVLLIEPDYTMQDRDS